MPTKDKRVEIRVDEESVAFIARAAEMAQESVSEFMRRAATDRAHRLLSHALTTVMPAEQFDALIATLDEADEAPALAVARKAPRQFTRR